MQLCKNYANLKHCIGQKFNANVIKATHRRRNFSETFVSQEIFVSRLFERFVAYKIPDEIDNSKVIENFGSFSPSVVNGGGRRNNLVMAKIN